MQAATIASTSAAFVTSAVCAMALPPSPVMISTVSFAAAALRSTQNTWAPSRVKVTAVALPLPQPGPIEPAPTTIAVLPLSRSIDFLLPLSFSFSCSPGEAKRNPGILPHNFPGFRFASSGLRIDTDTHGRDVRPDRVAKNLRQCPAVAIMAQPPFAGRTGIAEHDFRQRSALWLPLKPAIHQS